MYIHFDSVKKTYKKNEYNLKPIQTAPQVVNGSKVPMIPTGRITALFFRIISVCKL